MNIHISPMQFEHWPAVRSIFQQGIASGKATFELEAPQWEQWDGSHMQTPRLVALEHNHVIGWAALSPISERCIYSGVAEVSVYVAAHAQGKGAGRALLLALIEDSEDSDIWTLQAGIFPENQASIRLHTACGFRLVGRRERIGQIKGVWRDVLLYERRSARVGF